MKIPVVSRPKPSQVAESDAADAVLTGVGRYDGWSRGALLLGQVDLFAPVGLREDAVDLVQVAHGLEQGAEAEVSRGSERTPAMGTVAERRQARARTVVYNPIPSFAASSNSVAART